MRDDIVSHAVTVIDRGDFRGFRGPPVGRCRVLLVLGLLDHAVEQVLEGALLRRRL